MTYFIFAGDMMVMLFMVVLVIWVFMVSSDEDIDNAAMIPLRDDGLAEGLDPDQTSSLTNIESKEKGYSHG